MSNRTFRSLDAAPKLLLFTAKQWAALIADTAAVYGLVHVTHLAAKPAITLAVFLIGLPGALAYVSESGGLGLGQLLKDVCRWRLAAKQLPAASAAARVRGLPILPTKACPASGARVGVADMDDRGQPG